jgi:hypothetical protein
VAQSADADPQVIGRVFGRSYSGEVKSPLPVHKQPGVLPDGDEPIAMRVKIALGMSA